ncbi:hypothetical protein P389DRAFT_198040 [Cystobasidium minutum MCA 4210]|uniref:uncharacterized protein n=1 Tax=Cystobasidium minutum MCA 4210 TaxID=1397322 RepID=UPI0034CF01E0|eukprot:jgi/Rhomi1/198040/gm1.6254_g
MATLFQSRAARCLPVRPARLGSRYPSPRLQHRKIWTARTLVTDNAQDLLKAVPSDESISKCNVALFTISRNVPRDALSGLVDRFQNMPMPAIGCLSLGSDGNSGPYSLSYAFHESPSDRLEMIVPFRSTITGTPKISVGREVGRMEKRPETMEWAGDDSVVPSKLPSDLASLNSRFVENIFYFTDDQPQGLMRTLDTHLKEVTKTGLIASPTPFATGRPHTLFSGKDIYSDGAVGIAICRYPKQFESSKDLKVSYEGLEPLGGPLEVTACKGNIILEVASANATRTLLERIQANVASAITKDLGFYLGILPENLSEASVDQMLSVRPIIAGDPSRGALSLDTEANIRKGQRIQFFHTPKKRAGLRLSPSAAFMRDSTPNDRPAMIFQSDSDPDALKMVDSAQRSSDNFVAMSEQGFIVGRPSETSWICQVDGGQGDVKI